MDNINLPPLDLNQRYTLAETAAYLRQSRSKTWQDIKDGKLDVIEDGRRRYCPGTAIAARSAVDSAA